MKTCSKCGEVKALGEYHKNGGRLRSSCKACERERHANFYASNPEATKARVARVSRWLRNHPDAARRKAAASYARRRSYYQQRYLDNRDVFRARGAAWRAANTLRVMQCRTLYYARTKLERDIKKAEAMYA